MKNFRNRDVFITWIPLFTFPMWILFRTLRRSFKTDTITAKGVSESKSLQERRMLKNHFGKERPGLAFLSAKLRKIFGSDFGGDFEVMLRGTRPQKPKIIYNFVCKHSLLIKAEIIELNIGYR